MTEFGEEELRILQRALDSYPGGIDSPPNDQGTEFAAFVRLYEAGLIEGPSEPLVFSDGGSSRVRYRGCNITGRGRIVLAQLVEKLRTAEKPAPPTWEH